MVQMKFSANNENDNQKHLIPYLHTKQSNSFHAPFSYIFFSNQKVSYVQIFVQNTAHNHECFPTQSHHATHPSNNRKSAFPGRIVEE